jgi:hypothetical protein
MRQNLKPLLGLSVGSKICLLTRSNEAKKSRWTVPLSKSIQYIVNCFPSTIISFIVILAFFYLNILGIYQNTTKDIFELFQSRDCFIN